MIHRKNEQGGATNDLEKYELTQTVELATADVQLVARLARRPLLAPQRPGPGRAGNIA